MNGREHRVTALRILHVDDEPDIREVVKLSLGLDPAFVVRSCDSGGAALAAAADWLPDLILCDVMMPVMDGPAMLLRLRESSHTARVPIVFMTGFTHGEEVDALRALGATGVIAKPLDPMTLVKSVRGHLRNAGIAALRGGFVKRMHANAAVLIKCRADLADAVLASAALGEIKAFAHALAGAAGIFGFQRVTESAAGVEKVIIERLRGNNAPGQVESALDRLLADMQQPQMARRE
jgi:CheY-like chemotaxis protein